jgi:hypothetical protein
MCALGLLPQTAAAGTSGQLSGGTKPSQTLGHPSAATTQPSTHGSGHGSISHSSPAHGTASVHGEPGQTTSAPAHGDAVGSSQPGGQASEQQPLLGDGATGQHTAAAGIAAGARHADALGFLLALDDGAAATHPVVQTSFSSDGLAHVAHATSADS